MAGIKVGLTISRDAYKLIQEGKAMLSSGGVRLMNGQIYELAQPAGKMVLSSGGNPVIFGANLASSLANNVQSGIIQKSVNLANRKLDIVQGSMGAIKGLSWLNSAMGMVNCGISVAGFKMTLERLNDANVHIKKIITTIEKEVEQKLKREFETYRMNIKSDMDALEKFALTDAEKGNINEHMASIMAYLREVIDRFERHEIDGELGCSVIFNLAIAFCQEVKEYSAQYYYENGKLPPNYDEWVAILDDINSDEFREHLKQYLMFEMDIPMEQMQLSYENATYAIECKRGELDMNYQLVQNLTLAQYRNQAALMLEQIQNGNVDEDVNADVVFIPMTEWLES